nr:hypothetical protein Q903MT_gene3011 [Picea sitchensis]
MRYAQPSYLCAMRHIVLHSALCAHFTYTSSYSLYPFHCLSSWLTEKGRFGSQGR